LLFIFIHLNHIYTRNAPHFVNKNTEKDRPGTGEKNFLPPCSLLALRRHRRRKKWDKTARMGTKRVRVGTVRMGLIVCFFCSKMHIFSNSFEAFFLPSNQFIPKECFCCGDRWTQWTVNEGICEEEKIKFIIFYGIFSFGMHSESFQIANENI
jgi:hypothetical protein